MRQTKGIQQAYKQTKMPVEWLEIDLARSTEREVVWKLLKVTEQIA